MTAANYEVVDFAITNDLILLRTLDTLIKQAPNDEVVQIIQLIESTKQSLGLRNKAMKLLLKQMENV